MSRRKTEVATLTDADCDRIEALTREIRALERAARALVGHLPRCRWAECGALATHERMGEPRVCDRHANPNPPRGWAPDEPIAQGKYAEALRELLALLDGRRKGPKQ